MNVFDLPGPEFLLFYILFGALVAGAAYAVLWLYSGGHGRHPALLGDPYQIAYLRAGPNEAGRVGVVSLVDRGLLELAHPNLIRTGSQPPRDLHPIEREILANWSDLPGEASRVMAFPRVRNACSAAGEPLV